MKIYQLNAQGLSRNGETTIRKVSQKVFWTHTEAEMYKPTFRGECINSEIDPKNLYPDESIDPEMLKIEIVELKLELYHVDDPHHD